MVAIAIAKDVKGMASLQRGDAGQGPSFEDPSDKPLAEVIATAADIRLEDVVDDAAMANIKVGGAFFRSQIKRVAGEGAVSGSRHQWIVHVTNGVSRRCRHPESGSRASGVSGC